MNIQIAGNSSVEPAVTRRNSTETPGGAPRTSGAVATPQATEPQAIAHAASAPSTAAKAEREQVDLAVDSLNEFVASVQRDIRFQVDDDTGQAIVQVIDRKSESVVRQIPSEVALQLARQIKDDASFSLLSATS